MSRQADFEPAMEGMDWKQRVSFLKTAGPLVIDHTTRADLTHDFVSSLKDEANHRTTCSYGDVEVHTSVPKERCNGLDDAIVKTLDKAQNDGADVVEVATELRDVLSSMSPSDYPNGKIKDLEELEKELTRVPSDAMEKYIDGGLRWPLTNSEWTRLGLFMDSLNTMLRARSFGPEGLDIDMEATRGEAFKPELFSEDAIRSGATTLEMHLHISCKMDTGTVDELLESTMLDNFLELIEDAHQFTDVCDTDTIERWAEKRASVHATVPEDKFRFDDRKIGIYVPLNLSADRSRVHQKNNEYTGPGR